MIYRGDTGITIDICRISQKQLDDTLIVRL